MLTIHQNDVTLLDSFFSQDTRKDLYLMQQLLVRILLLRLCHRTIKDDCRLVAVPRLDMSIHTIITCGDLPVREPLPVIMFCPRLECLARLIQDSRGLLVPV